MVDKNRKTGAGISLLSSMGDNMSDFTLNLNTATPQAIAEIMEMDNKFIGTMNYLGLAYFWGHEYKHSLRDATISQRKRIHRKGLERNVSFLVPNQEAWDIIKEVIK